MVLGAVFAGSEAVIEHVGSTAVPGLGAKPVIDVMVGVSQLAEAEGRVGALEGAGYEYVQKYEIELPERRYFRKPSARPEYVSSALRRQGKQFLGSPPRVSGLSSGSSRNPPRLLRVERELAVRFSKEEYTEAKSPFSERILFLR